MQLPAAGHDRRVVVAHPHDEAVEVVLAAHVLGRRPVLPRLRLVGELVVAGRAHVVDAAERRDRLSVRHPGAGGRHLRVSRDEAQVEDSGRRLAVALALLAGPGAPPGVVPSPTPAPCARARPRSARRPAPTGPPARAARRPAGARASASQPALTERSICRLAAGTGEDAARSSSKPSTGSVPLGRVVPGDQPVVDERRPGARRGSGATIGTHHQPPPARNTSLPHPAIAVKSRGPRSRAGLIA